MNELKFKLSKENKRWLDLYNNSELTSLNYAYKEPSFYKRKSWDNICENLKDLTLRFGLDNTWDAKILNYNPMTYTAAFLFRDTNKGVEYLKVYTAWNTYEIAIKIFDLETFLKKYNLSDLEVDSIKLLLELGDFNYFDKKIIKEYLKNIK